MEENEINQTSEAALQIVPTPHIEVDDLIMLGSIKDQMFCRHTIDFFVPASK